MTNYAMHHCPHGRRLDERCAVCEKLQTIEERHKRNTAARNIAAALWWAWHKQREIAENTSRLDREAHLEERAREEAIWNDYVMARRMAEADDEQN